MIIGIDLGTTNSLCAVWSDGEARLIPNALGDDLTPSVVGLDDNGDILVGRAARERLVTHPELTTSAFKRHMGSDRVTPLGKKDFRAEELSAMVLRALKEDAEKALGCEVTEAVITVPAYFNDAQRKATRNAGEIAGLKVERLLNEPTAAALAYGLHQKDAETQFLVFDLGGGTFDVSILELFDGIMEVHASAGDNFLGGEDFVTEMVKGFCTEHDINHTKLSSNRQRALREAAERAKRSLTSNREADMTVRIDERELSWTLTEASFTTLCEPLLRRLRAPVERALRDADIRARELDAVVLVGGSTRKPIVQSLVAKMFGQLPLRHINPDEVVAQGAAVQAGLKARDSALNEVVLTDVCPYTLGFEVTNQTGENTYQEGIFSPLIERNSVIPSSREDRVVPITTQQRKIEVRVFQGESRQVKDNIFLGKVAVPIPNHDGNTDRSIDIRYTYDINGLLEVQATVVATQKQHKLIIEQNPGSMSAKEIAQRLEQLAKAARVRGCGVVVGQTMHLVGPHVDVGLVRVYAEDRSDV